MHPPVALDSIVANLEFEMIGRPDPAIAPDALWLTGYERSTLGPELARHGAHLVADPHPYEHFFRRSDNYALAKTGIIAQTVSSFGLHKDYHQVSDELSTIDWAHMSQAIGSCKSPSSGSSIPIGDPHGSPAASPEQAHLFRTRARHNAARTAAHHQANRPEQCRHDEHNDGRPHVMHIQCGQSLQRPQHGEHGPDHPETHGSRVEHFPAALQGDGRRTRLL